MSTSPKSAKAGAPAVPPQLPALKPVHQKAFEQFDELPDSAKVPVQVVAAVEGISAVSVWRRSKSGLLPAPEKTGGTTRWLVGDLRAARRGA